MARGKIKKEKGQLKGYRSSNRITLRKSPEQEIVYIDHIGAKKSVDTDKIFVIQKHKTDKVHYDFRLEIDGVLKSWTIPKGPSLNPQIKRMAIPSDDRPIEYANYEGIASEGQCGTGPVMAWDLGTYLNIKRGENGKIQPIKKCYKEGWIEIYLEGEKLYGDFALIRTARTKNGKRYWHLIKMKDEYVSTSRSPLARRTKSALTGRTLTQIKKEAKT